MKVSFLISCLLIQHTIGSVDDQRDCLPDLLKAGFQLTDITAHDGIVLKSIFFDPPPSSPDKKNPIVIFISSWGLNKWEYVVPATDYANKGYTVVSYTARGFWKSGGLIDMAGANDMADVSTVIDWALANTFADSARVGLSGISYGGGISILGSAFDSRVKCVAAMSCWIDLAESFLGNGETIRKEAVRALQLLAEVTGEPSEDLETVFKDYFSNENLDFLYSFTYNSSAINFIPEINKNKPAIFIANALGDSLFTPNQFQKFFDALNLPKHIEFAPGDHAGPELPGIFGLPDQVWTRAGQWNDFYLLAGNNGIDESMPLVIYNAMKGDEIEEYNSFDDIVTSTIIYELRNNERLTTTRSESSILNSIIASISSGENANINGGIPYITSTIRAYMDYPKSFKISNITREYAAVFVSDRLDSDVHVRGIPNIKLSILPQSENCTLVIYILDVDNLNIGHTITFSPWTIKGVTAGEATNADIDLTMTSYDISQGHRVAVVVQTHDNLFLDQAPQGTRIDFQSGSMFTLPLNDL